MTNGGDRNKDRSGRHMGWRRAVKQDFLIWIGGLGTAFSLFSNHDSIFRFAKFVQHLSENWKSFLHWFWSWIFDLIGLGIVLEKGDALVITLLALMTIPMIKSMLMKQKEYIELTPFSIIKQLSFPILIFWSVASFYYVHSELEFTREIVVPVYLISLGAVTLLFSYKKKRFEETNKPIFSLRYLGNFGFFSLLTLIGMFVINFLARLIESAPPLPTGT